MDTEHAGPADTDHVRERAAMRAAGAGVAAVDAMLADLWS
jgi:hypothetical protein